MKKLKITVKELVATAKSQIEEFTASQVIQLLSDKNVVIVDIRDIRERQKLGFIPGSFHAPRGMLEFWIDPESPYFKKIFSADKKFILHCAAGWRSALSVQTLNNMGFPTAHISDGFKGWIEADGPVEFYESRQSENKGR